MPSNTEGFSQVSVPAGSTAQAAGGTLDNGGTRATHSMIITVSNATFTSGTVTLQISQDNVNWLSVASPPTLTTNAVFSQTVTAAAQFVRANITAAIVGGASVGVTVASA
jgi:hypothetical protein